MLETLSIVYLIITLGVFFVSACTSNKTYGRGVSHDVDWEAAFVMAIIWPLALLFLLVLAIWVLLESWREIKENKDNE